MHLPEPVEAAIASTKTVRDTITIAPSQDVDIAPRHTVRRHAVDGEYVLRIVIDDRIYDVIVITSHDQFTPIGKALKLDKMKALF